MWTHRAGLTLVSCSPALRTWLGPQLLLVPLTGGLCQARGSFLLWQREAADLSPSSSELRVWVQTVQLAVLQSESPL